ncbi:hypothetical protein CL6EHI_049410 [Entamoeba histolytica]|nr:hypothetical protein CL6EHI_049410 [Entamoeba histolytica]
MTSQSITQTWLDLFNEVPVSIFEKYGGFILYFYIIFQCGYGTHYLVDRYIIPIFNKYSIICNYVFKTNYFTPLIIQTGSCLPELCIGILGLIFMKYYSTSSSLIIGSSFESVVIMSGLSIMLSHDFIEIAKISFIREALILLISILFYYIFAKSLNSQDDLKIGQILLWLSLGVYLFYILAIYLTNKLSKEIVISKGFLNNTTPLNITENDGIPNKLHSELQLFKSPDYSNVSYSSSQWSEHWTDLYFDELVIRKDRSPHSPPLISINIDDISYIICDNLDNKIFDIYTIDHKQFGFRSSRRMEWVESLNKMIVSNSFDIGITCKDLLCENQITERLVDGFVWNIFYPIIKLFKITIPFKLFKGSSLISLILSLSYLSIFGFIEILLSIRLQKIFNLPSDVLAVSIISILGNGMRHFINAWNAGRMNCGNLAIIQGYSQSIFMLLVSSSLPWLVFIYLIKPVMSISSTFSPNVLEFSIGSLFFLIIIHLLLSLNNTNVAIGKKFGFTLLMVFMFLFVLVLIPPFLLSF